MKKPELCIGTVQFGTKYGITNENGIVNLDEAKRIGAKLRDSEKFYKLCSETTLKRYETNYTEEVWKLNWKATHK